MRRFFLTNSQIENCVVEGEEFNHLKNVLRMAIGDNFIAICNDDYNYFCKIVDIKKDYAKFEITNKEINTKNPNKCIALFQGLAKGDKLELIAQKSTEIGVSKYYPVYFNNCDVKADTHKIERLEKIVNNACKQCGRSRSLEVFGTIKVKDMITELSQYDLVLFANEREDEKKLIDILNEHQLANSVAIIVGPEGGFTDDEINLIKSTSAISVSLGNRILRTETASIFLSSVVASYYNV